MKLIFDDVGSGPAVLFLHAFPLSRKMWSSQIEALQATGFRAVAPDLPGFGESPALPANASLDDLANEIDLLLQALDLQKVIVCGLSMGGYVAFNLLNRVHERLSALILCDTSHLPDTIEKQNSRFELIEKITQKGNIALVEELLPNLISPTSFENNPPLVEYLIKELDEVKTETVKTALRAMAARRDSSDLLATIRVPTALIFGRLDKITDLQTATTMRQQIANAELFSIEGAGHLSNLEQPQSFNRILIDFCQKVTPA